MEALGLGVILIGSRLRRNAAQALGRQFTVRLSLLDDHQLTAREVLPGRIEQHHHLERKPQRAVEILVEAVIVAGGLS